MLDRSDEFVTRYPPGHSRLRGWSSRVWAMLLNAVAAIFVVIMAQWGTYSHTWIVFQFSRVLSLLVLSLLVCLSGRAWVRSYRYLAPDGQRAQESDGRPPVLYLRSFSDDKQTSRTGRRGAAVFRTEEQQLKRAFGRFGPFIAIGQPGERLPPAGAARIYTPDADWRQIVVEHIRQAGLVLINAGISAGLMWEIGQAVSLVAPEKIVILVPFGKNAYDDFRSRAAIYLGRNLPAWVDGERLSSIAIHAAVYFEQDWTDHFVRLDTGKRLTLEESCYRYISTVFRRNGISRPGCRGMRLF